MPVIQKFLLILALLHHDGTYTFEQTLVSGGCPPQEFIMMNMEARQKKGEFYDWDGGCIPMIFKAKESL